MFRHLCNLNVVRMNTLLSHLLFKCIARALGTNRFVCVDCGVRRCGIISYARHCSRRGNLYSEVIGAETTAIYEKIGFQTAAKMRALRPNHTYALQLQFLIRLHNAMANRSAQPIEWYGVDFSFSSKTPSSFFVEIVFAITVCLVLCLFLLLLHVSRIPIDEMREFTRRKCARSINARLFDNNDDLAYSVRLNIRGISSAELSAVASNHKVNRKIYDYLLFTLGMIFSSSHIGWWMPCPSSYVANNAKSLQ